MTAITKSPLAVAHEGLASIQRQGIVSADDLLDEVELGDWRKIDFFTEYDRLGESCIRWFRHKAHLERLSRAKNQILAAVTLHDPDMVYDIATTRLKKANCGPLSTLAAVEASRECSALVVTFETEIDAHAFVILDHSIKPKSSRALKEGTLSTIFAKYPKGVVFDPLLKVVCLVSEVASTRLIKYMKLWQLERVTHVEVIPRGSPKAAKLLQDAERLHKYVKEFDLTKIHCESLTLLNKLLKECVGPKSASALENWFPKTHWAVGVKEGIMSLSMDGTDETTKPVSDKLKAIGMSAKRFRDKKTQKNYQVVLTNPNEAPLGEVFKRNTAILELILNYVQ